MNGSALGLIGVGTMGAGLARNLSRAGFTAAVYDQDPARSRALEIGRAHV